MAQGDYVVMNFDGVLDSRPRLFGQVVAVPQADTSTVVWQNGKQTTVPDALLKEVVLPSNNRTDFIGKWGQLVDWDPAGSLSDQTPKSPAAAGLVRQLYDAQDIGGGNRFGHAVLEILDGKDAIVVYQNTAESDLTEIAVNDGRRTVRGQ